MYSHLYIEQIKYFTTAKLENGTQFEDHNNWL